MRKGEKGRGKGRSDRERTHRKQDLVGELGLESEGPNVMRP